MLVFANKCYWVIVLLVFWAVEVYAQEVITIPQSTSSAQQTLTQRWEWAHQEAQRRNIQGSYWIGYSIVQLMREDSFYGSFSSDARQLKTLEEILFGTTHQSYRRDRDYIEDPSARFKLVQKDIAVLFRYQLQSGISGKPEKIAATNIGLYFDNLNLPIIWVGGSTDEESVEFLTGHYEQAVSIDVKGTILSVLSLYQRSVKVLELLKNVVQGRESEKLRKKAAVYLGRFEDNATLNLLKEIAESDRSTEVAESAVFGISRMENEASLDVLIALARTAKRDGVRKKAVYSLSQYASDKVMSTLTDIVLNDNDLQLQKHTVYALSRMKRDDTIPQLISLAKTHRNNEIRKYAIYMLGQSKDERALDALINLVLE